MSCREWKQVRLGDIADIVMGQSPKGETCNNNKIGVPLLNGPTEFGSSHPTAVQWTEDPRKHSIAGDILFCVRGSTTGRMNWSNTDYAIGRGLAAIRHKKGKEYNYFIKAILGYKLEDILASATGSTFPNVGKEVLNSLNVNIPTLSEQKAIAATLSCLDYMIELNNHANQVLEEMAQAIFKHWFVDFEFPNEDGQPYKSSGGAMLDSELGEIPEGWRVGRFNELIDKTISGDWGKANPQGKFTQKVVCVRGADIPEIAKGNKGNAPYRYINTKNLANKALGPYEMIVEISGGSPTQSTGRCALISEELINSYEVPILCTNFCRAIKFTKPEYSYFVYENWKYKYNNDIFFQYENGTTGIKNLDFLGVLTREPIIIPTDRLLTDYSKTLVTFTKTICKKAGENNVLSNIRDTLLPKLMSGEIRVPVEEVG